MLISLYLEMEQSPVDFNETKSKIRNEILQRVWYEQAKSANPPLKKL